MKTILKRIYKWIDERAELEGLVEFMGKKYVPVHRHSIWYYFGGVTLFLFIIQVVTGIRSEGPSVANKINRGIARRMDRDGVKSVSEYTNLRHQNLAA